MRTSTPLTTTDLKCLSDQVAALHDELAGLRSEMERQWAVHSEKHRRVDEDHIVERLEALEDWRVEMVTLGRIVKATFGASVIGAVAASIALWETLTRALGN